MLDNNNQTVQHLILGQPPYQFLDNNPPIGLQEGAIFRGHTVHLIDPIGI